jgi:hypothetical protein
MPTRDYLDEELERLREELERLRARVEPGAGAEADGKAPADDRP